MTVEEIKDRVQKIRDLAGDDERAHSMEDDLHQDVLAEIANGAPNAAELAREALLTLGIEFARWCA